MTSGRFDSGMPPRIHASGTSGLLLDVSEGVFSLSIQKRLWSFASEAGALRCLEGVRGMVLGVNNVLVSFDPMQVHPRELADHLRQAWGTSQPCEENGRLLEVPVTYDTSRGSELEGVARHAELGVDDVIRLHTSVEYHVACIGSVPGFAYLVGLPRELSMPRHATPRPRVPKGTVAIGGSQTGVIPMDMPSGWHALGMTELDMFDPSRAAPCLLAPGDRIRFSARGAKP
jgi:KipI family sensor histidine kinase inhibitor